MCNNNNNNNNKGRFLTKFIPIKLLFFFHELLQQKKTNSIN